MGVIIVGRPIARNQDDGWTAEITRCAVLDGHPNACSMLYGAAWRAARAMGYRRIISYTQAQETGASLRAAGFHAAYQTKGESWHRKARPRVDTGPPVQKTLWERGNNTQRTPAAGPAEPQ